jgi:hypothetical protein
MELKPASVWVFNSGNTHVVLNDLGITLAPNEHVDIFKKQPNLTWTEYQKSLESGSLKYRKNVKVTINKLNLLGQVHDKTTFSEHDIKAEPIPSRSKSCVYIPPGQEDYLEVIEMEFSKDGQQLGQAELWKSERDKFIKTLEDTELGNDGEIFSDKLFEDEYLNS